MKSVTLPLVNNETFDSQYTYELHGYLSLKEHTTLVQLLNETVYQHPNPEFTICSFIILWCVWILFIVLSYIIWRHRRGTWPISIGIILIFLSLVIYLIIYRYRRQKFEEAILDVCQRLNATENIRGIHYRWMSSTYSVVIEFDDRYNAITSDLYNRDFVSIPLNAHIPPPVYEEKYLH
ncbi:hypothetical protein BDB01DRAFT_788484 [Pilobolus umbonatus]|nr:hypothetical protein BDB01DRAFT_788484 [Pilobolus umbonatus]